eukprot:43868-Amphidinium_carterae.1
MEDQIVPAAYTGPASTPAADTSMVSPGLSEELSRLLSEVEEEFATEGIAHAGISDDNVSVDRPAASNAVDSGVGVHSAAMSSQATAPWPYPHGVPMNLAQNQERVNQRISTSLSSRSSGRDLQEQYGPWEHTPRRRGRTDEGGGAEDPLVRDDPWRSQHPYTSPHNRELQANSRENEVRRQLVHELDNARQHMEQQQRTLQSQSQQQQEQQRMLESERTRLEQSQLELQRWTEQQHLEIRNALAAAEGERQIFMQRTREEYRHELERILASGQGSSEHSEQLMKLMDKNLRQLHEQFSQDIGRHQQVVARCESHMNNALQTMEQRANQYMKENESRLRTEFQVCMRDNETQHRQSLEKHQVEMNELHQQVERLKLEVAKTVNISAHGASSVAHGAFGGAARGAISAHGALQTDGGHIMSAPDRATVTTRTTTTPPIHPPGLTQGSASERHDSSRPPRIPRQNISRRGSEDRSSQEPQRDVSWARYSEFRETTRRKLVEEPDGIECLKALVRVREAEKINLKEQPNAASLQSWLVLTRQEIISASGRSSSDVLPWILEAEDSKASLDELGNTRGFASLDSKLASALLKTARDHVQWTLPQERKSSNRSSTFELVCEGVRTR